MKFVKLGGYAAGILVAVFSTISAEPALGAQAVPPDPYDLSWTTPSKDSSGSMPLGNGDIGLNAWVEEDGDLLFYISKTDAWSENAQLLKLGRIRVKLSPSPFQKSWPFLQTLRLRQGEINIHAGARDSELTLRLWADANQPVIRVEAACERNFELEAVLEVWRDKPRRLEGRELDSVYGMEGCPHPIISLADTILLPRSNRIVWFHRNSQSIWPETMKLQGLGSFMSQSSDPLLNRTFGGAMQGNGLLTVNTTTLKSKVPGRRFVLSVYPLTQQTASAEEWLQDLDHQIECTESRNTEQAREAHRKWWSDFWERSWIRLSGSDEAERVDWGYALQRFIAACAGRGSFPIKFNGSIFTVDAREKDETFNADYRRWGGPYWFQNTRLPYWPMLATGDFDLMQPFFRMYFEALPLFEYRTHLYFGHDGAFFPETMYFWGSYANANYGWDRQGKSMAQVDNTYIRYYWQGGLELSAIMLDYFAYTEDTNFARRTLIPLADDVVRFYDQRYSRDSQGKILLKPAGALETWHEAVNPLPEIAGLEVVLKGLLSLPPQLTTNQQQANWKRLQGELPPLPTAKEGERTKLLAAQELIGPIKNIENPELYAIFPYRLFGLGKPDLETGRFTFEQRRIKRNGGWHQDAIQAAYLGLAEAAQSAVSDSFSAHHARSRFPAFWGPNYDWIPDQDHGSVASMALQTMLLQTEGKKILLFPAWPKSWDVEFKLHAPLNTVIEGSFRAGQLQRLAVSPAVRTQDVLKMTPQ